VEYWYRCSGLKVKLDFVVVVTVSVLGMTYSDWDAQSRLQSVYVEIKSVSQVSLPEAT
jgi:hypothetical protein